MFVGLDWGTPHENVAIGPPKTYLHKVGLKTEAGAIKTSKQYTTAQQSQDLKTDHQGLIVEELKEALEKIVAAVKEAELKLSLSARAVSADLSASASVKARADAAQAVKDHKDEADAYALINTLYTLESRKLTYPGYRALHHELRSQKANFKVGREKALDNEWICLSRHSGHLLLTELGREQARNRQKQPRVYAAGGPGLG